MANVKINSNTIKYSDGKKMMRISVDVPYNIGKSFKTFLKTEGKTMTSVIKQEIENYLGI